MCQVSQKIINYAFGRLCNRKFVDDIKTKIYNHQSLANLGVKILLGKITHLKEPEIRQMSARDMYWKEKYTSHFWSLNYLLLKLKFYSETANGIIFTFQCQVNHGPELNVESLIPIQTLLTGISLIL